MKYVLWGFVAIVIFSALFLKVFQPEMVESSSMLMQLATWLAITIPSVCITVWAGMKLFFGNSR